MTHFPPFKFDPEDRTLWRGAAEVPLTPKASDLLACLLRARGAWVSRSAILSTVWPDTHVQPENVKVLVREIRRALGDSIASPAFIRSRARRGYAFVAATVERESPVADGLLPAQSPPYVTRTRELSLLGAALAADAAPLVLVTGGHGDGKTSLCDAFVRAVRAAGTARVCYGQCFDRESAHESYILCSTRCSGSIAPTPTPSRGFLPSTRRRGCRSSRSGADRAATPGSSAGRCSTS